MATLQMINVTKKFGKSVIAVNDLNLEVHEGEFLVLLGPSGCGKTTAMRMVAGLEEVTSGRIIIDGKDVTDLPPRNRNISMIFQNYAVWPHMTVYENIAYALRLKRMDKAKIDNIVNDVARMTKIGELLERLPTQLSGGQRQRVAVARAIAVEPKIFLMDEPLSNLDAKLRVSMRTELKAIHTKTNATSVFVTHDQSEAMSMADRIVIMRDGEIMQVGSPEDVYERSANLFVADFIGTPPTNFIDAEIKSDNGNVHLTNPYFDMELSPEAAAPFKTYDKTKLTIGVRPEKVLLTDSASATFSAKCLVSEPQGSHQVIAFELGDKIVKVIAQPTPKIEPGETIHLAFKPENVRFFDPESTLAITND